MCSFKIIMFLKYKMGLFFFLSGPFFKETKKERAGIKWPYHVFWVKLLSVFSLEAQCSCVMCMWVTFQGTHSHQPLCIIHVIEFQEVSYNVPFGYSCLLS